VMLVLLADLTRLATVDRDIDHYTLVGGASIYPFAWSILLAARTEELAGVMTTMVVRDEATVLELLGVPDTHIVAGVLALGHPVRQPSRLRRGPVEEFASVDRFDGPALEGG
jgi:nitroreductase